MSLRYLNGFTVISFNPDNIFVSFKTESYKINENGRIILENHSNDDNNDNLLQINNNLISQDEEIQKEYWIINKDGKNKIVIKGSEEFIQYKNNIKAGPFFSIDIVVLYLNYFNDMGF